METIKGLTFYQIRMMCMTEEQLDGTVKVKSLAEAKSLAAKVAARKNQRKDQFKL